MSMGTTIRGLMNTSSAMAAESYSYSKAASDAKGFEEALTSAAEAQDKAKLKTAAQEFESYFIQMMFKEMRGTVPTDGLIPKNNAEQIFQSMLDEEVAANAAEGQGIGLAKMIYEQMTRENYSVAPPVDPLNRRAQGGVGIDKAAEPEETTAQDGMFVGSEDESL